MDGYTGSTLTVFLDIFVSELSPSMPLFLSILLSTGVVSVFLLSLH